jgi:hypothetical protein
MPTIHETREFLQMQFENTAHWRRAKAEESMVRILSCF